MNLREQIIQEINTIRDRHKWDKNGHDIVESFVHLYKINEIEIRKMIIDIFLDELDKKNDIFLNTVLETQLTERESRKLNIETSDSFKKSQELTNYITERLWQALQRTSDGDLDWKESLISALLKLNHEKAIPIAVDFLRHNLYKEFGTANDLLLDLVNLDKEEFVNFCVKFFSDQFTPNKYNEVLGNQARDYIHAFLKLDSKEAQQLIQWLLNKTFQKSPTAAQKIKELFIYHLRDAQRISPIFREKTGPLLEIIEYKK